MQRASSAARRPPPPTPSDDLSELRVRRPVDRAETTSPYFRRGRRGRDLDDDVDGNRSLSDDEEEDEVRQAPSDAALPAAAAQQLRFQATLPAWFKRLLTWRVARALVGASLLNVLLVWVVVFSLTVCARDYMPLEISMVLGFLWATGNTMAVLLPIVLQDTPPPAPASDDGATAAAPTLGADTTTTTTTLTPSRVARLRGEDGRDLFMCCGVDRLARSLVHERAMTAWEAAERTGRAALSRAGWPSAVSLLWVSLAAAIYVYNAHFATVKDRFMPLSFSSEPWAREVLHLNRSGATHENLVLLNEGGLQQARGSLANDLTRGAVFAATSGAALFLAHSLVIAGSGIGVGLSLRFRLVLAAVVIAYLPVHFANPRPGCERRPGEYRSAGTELFGQPPDVLYQDTIGRLSDATRRPVTDPSGGVPRLSSARRAQHPYPHACACGILRIASAAAGDPSVPPSLRHGLFAMQGHEFPILMRFSSGSRQTAERERLADVHGAAIKVFLPAAHTAPATEGQHDATPDHRLASSPSSALGREPELQSMPAGRSRTPSPGLQRAAAVCGVSADSAAREQDLLLWSSPVFFFGDDLVAEALRTPDVAQDEPRGLHTFLRLTTGGLADGLAFATRKGWWRFWEWEVWPVVRAARILFGNPVRNPLDALYFSASPYRLGPGTTAPHGVASGWKHVGAHAQAVRYALRPCPAGARGAPNLHVDVVARERFAEHTQWLHGLSGTVRPRRNATLSQLGTSHPAPVHDATLGDVSACFELLVQPQVSACAQRLDDPTRDWEAPYFMVGRVLLPRAAPSSAKSNEVSATCEATAFDIWNTLQAHEPIGLVNEARFASYNISRALRSSSESPSP